MLPAALYRQMSWVGPRFEITRLGRLVSPAGCMFENDGAPFGQASPGVVGTAAGRAGFVDHAALAPAGLARLGEPEAPLVPAPLAGALAVGADPGHGAGLGAGAVARLARTLAGQPQRHGAAVGRYGGRECDLGFHVCATPGGILSMFRWRRLGLRAAPDIAHRDD